MLQVVPDRSPANNCPANQLVIGYDFVLSLKSANPKDVEFVDAIAGSSIFLMFPYDESLVTRNTPFFPYT